MVAFIIFQKIKNQLKKRNILLVNDLIFDKSKQFVQIDGQKYDFKVIDFEGVKEIKDVSFVKLTKTYILVKFENGKEITLT